MPQKRPASGALPLRANLQPPVRAPAPQDVQRLCSALASNLHVTELSISAHALDAECAEKFAELLSSPVCHLKALSLGDSTFGDQAMTALCKGIAGNTTLTALDAEHKVRAPARSLSQCRPPLLRRSDAASLGHGDASFLCAHGACALPRVCRVLARGERRA